MPDLMLHLHERIAERQKYILRSIVSIKKRVPNKILSEILHGKVSITFFVFCIGAKIADDQDAYASQHEKKSQI